jgi:hypothetical protein
MAYIGNSPGVASQRIVTTFTATASQTTFTPTSGYTVGYLDVYLNGVKLINGDDYTASNGSTFVLASGAASGDIVESVAYLPRGLSDGYTKAEADGRYPLASNLSNVENKSSATIRSEITSGNVTTALGYSPTTMVAPKWTLTGSQFNEAGLTNNRRIVLGTCYLPQGGADVRITLYCGAGYNAAADQYDEYVIRFRTSNGSSNVAGSSGAFYANGWVEHIKYGVGDPVSSVLVEQVDTQTYRFSFDPSTLIGFYSHYEVTAWNSGVWTHSGTVVDGAPTVNYLTLSTTAVRSGGVNTAASQPHFYIHNTSSPNQTPANEQTVLHYNTVRRNTGNHYNSSTRKFTAPVDGVYAITATARFDGCTAYSRLSIAINGQASQAHWTPGAHFIAEGSSMRSHSVSCMLYLSANDYIQAVGGTTNGSGQHQGEGHFSAILVG